MENNKIFIVSFILILMLFFIVKILNIDEYIFFIIKTNQSALVNFVNESYLFSVILFILTHMIVSLLPVGGDTILTILGGFLYGTYLGTIYSLISVVVSATFIFLLVKFLVRHHFKFKYEQPKVFIKLKSLVGRIGIVYVVLIIRILPIFPLFISNVLISLTSISLINFMWTTIIGMMPIIFTYSYSGQKIHQINSPNQVLNIPIILILLTLCMAVITSIVIKELLVKKK